MAAGVMATDAADVQGVGHGHQNHADQGQAMGMLIMGRQQVIGHQSQA